VGTFPKKSIEKYHNFCFSFYYNYFQCRSMYILSIS
jgi:hypothetical protein